MHPQFYLGFWTGIALTLAITAAFGWLFIGANALSDRAAKGKRWIA